jgi:hypothetical protein
MNAIEHLEHIIGLVGKAPDSEIKGKLIAIREEVSGNAAAAAQYSELAEKYAALEKKHLTLQNAQPKETGEKCPFCKLMTLQLIDTEPIPGLELHGIKTGHYKCANPKCGKTYDKQVKD